MLNYNLADKGDEELFSLIQKDNLKAFEVLFKRFYPLLCAYANQFVELNDSHDIVQDIMIWVWENRNNEFINTSIKSYLFKTVKNKCITLINHNVMKQRVFNTLFPQEFTEQSLFTSEAIAKINKAINSLPVNYREAFILNRFQGMTYNDIAKKLNVSPKTID